MTQYDSKKSTADKTPVTPEIATKNKLEKQMNSLSDIVRQQEKDLKELQRLVRKLQNELRVAVNSFNLKNRE
jgi:hypothetical protein